MKRIVLPSNLAVILAGGILLVSTLQVADPAEGSTGDGLAREFVAAAHSDLERVRELAHRHPELVHAAVATAEGEWETALAAAAHSGRTDIVAYLLGKGARIDVVAACAMGYDEVVRAIVEAYPVMRDRAPVHGRSLVEIVRASGADEEIEAILASERVGDPADAAPLTAALRQRYAGRFRTKRGFTFSIVERDGALMLHPSEAEEPLEMLHLGHHEFRAGKDPTVRMIFDGSGGASERIAIDEGRLQDSDGATRIE